jgi:hypothetical protein
LRERIKKTYFKITDIISASEIGQYQYCSIAWYLQKKGYKPLSPKLEIGIKKHIKLGKIIEVTQKKVKKSMVFALAGYLMLILSILILIIEVGLLIF